MAESPVVVLLKQTSPSNIYFAELSQDLALRLGHVAAYTDSNWNVRSASLRILIGPSYCRNSVFSRLWSWLKYFIGAARVVWSLRATALLFIVAQPPFLPFLGYLRNLWYGQKYVVWVDDIYPDALVRSGVLGEAHPVVRAWRWLNRLMLKRAERVFTLGPLMAEVLGQYIPGGMQRIVVIPTWADTESVHPIPKESNPFACEHGQVGKLTVQYSGNLGLTHELDTLLQAAERMQDQTGIHFMIIGSGPARDKVVQSAAQLSNTTVLPLQPADVVPYSLTTADVSVVTQRKGIEGVSMPSKTYHAMAAGSALLGVSHSPSDLESVIETYRCGINVEPGDVDGFVQAVVKFRDTEYLVKCRKNARRAAETEFSRTVNVQRVFDAINPLLTTQWSSLREKSGALKSDGKRVLIGERNSVKDQRHQFQVIRNRFEREAHDFDAIYRQDQGRIQTWLNRRFRKPVFERYEIAFQEMGQLAGRTLLDIGCGSGIYCVGFVSSGGQHASGIDLSSAMITLASQRAGEVGVADACEFEHVNFLETKLAKQYDFVIAMGVFDYLSDPVAFLHKMRSVAVCKVIVSLPGHSLIRESLRKLRYGIGSKGAVYFYNETDIQRMAAEAGITRFKVIPMTTGSGFVFVGEA